MLQNKKYSLTKYLFEQIKKGIKIFVTPHRWTKLSFIYLFKTYAILPYWLHFRESIRFWVVLDKTLRPRLVCGLDPWKGIIIPTE
jgi:hypothetical protein